MTLVACEALEVESCGSPVPMGSADDAVFYTELVGAWECQELEAPPSEEASIYRVFRFNDTEYVIEASEEEQEAWHLRAYVIAVDDIPFLNLQLIDSIEAEYRGYHFYRLDRIENDQLRLRLVDSADVLHNLESSEEVREFIRGNVDNDEIYDDNPPIICSRTAEDPTT